MSNEYRTTVNLPGQPRGQVATWPDSPQTAILVGQGVLVPVVKAMTEPEAAPAAPWPPPEWSQRTFVPLPAEGVPADPPAVEEPEPEAPKPARAGRRPRKAAAAPPEAATDDPPSDAPDAADGD